jgi:hypothetical protein
MPTREQAIRLVPAAASTIAAIAEQGIDGILKLMQYLQCKVVLNDM